MKIRRSIFGFVVIVAVLIALVLWYRMKKSVETPPTTAPNLPVSANTLPAQPMTNTNVATPSTQNKGEQMKEGLTAMNDVPIVFYGRLADQFGSPVVGAKIAANVRIYNGVQSTVEHLKTMSDGNGFFQIQGGKGESLGVVPTKEGYVLAATDTYFRYSYMYPDHFSPDPNNPTVIKMWKLQGAEPLVDISKKYELPFTSAPIFFDLVAGKIVTTGGDLKITVSRPAGIISQQHPQDWSIQIEVEDGGLIETSFAESRITYSAPEDGYQATDTLENNNGPDLVDKMFFIQSRNGQVYSKVHLLFGINNMPDELMSVTFSGVANTNSSRNWEATAPQ